MIQWSYYEKVKWTLWLGMLFSTRSSKVTKHMFGLTCSRQTLYTVKRRNTWSSKDIEDIQHGGRSYVWIRYGWTCYGGIVWVYMTKIQGVAEGILVIRVVTAVGHAVICGHASSSMDIFIGYNILIGRYIIRCPVQDILLLWSDISNIGLRQTRALTRELSSTFNDVLAFGINTDSWTETQSSYKAVDWEKLSTGDTHNLLELLPRAQILEHHAPYWSERWYTDCLIF